MKKETRERKYNIKDISNTLNEKYLKWSGLTNATDDTWENATYLELTYYGQLVYFINSKPFGTNLFGKPLKEENND